MLREFRPRPKAPRFSGPPRVRHEPPTIEEAVSAAQDLAGEVEQQVAIVAGLMGLPEEQARPHVLSASQRRPAPRALSNVARPSSGPEVVIVRRRFRSV